MPRRTNSAGIVIAIVIIAILAFAYFNYSAKKPDGVSAQWGSSVAPVVGSSFAVFNGIPNVNWVIFTITATNDVNVPENITIYDVVGNSANLDAMVAQIKTDAANQPKPTTPTQQVSWLTSQLGITTIPTGNYSLTWYLRATSAEVNLAPFENAYQYNFTLAQPAVIIGALNYYTGGGSCCQGDQYRTFTRVAWFTATVNQPASKTFSVWWTQLCNNGVVLRIAKCVYSDCHYNGASLWNGVVWEQGLGSSFTFTESGSYEIYAYGGPYNNCFGELYSVSIT